MQQAWVAGLWGLAGGSSLVIGAIVGWYFTPSQRVIAAAMAIGIGALISAIAFELMDDAFAIGGFRAVSTGFLAGAVVFSLANWMLARSGGKHRKRSGTAHPAVSIAGKSGGIAIAVGALLDGIPESLVIGASLLDGRTVSLVTVLAIFLSNFPEALSSTAGMKQSGRSRAYAFGIWFGIALASGLAAMIGNLVLAGAAPAVTAVVMAFAAGAILAMLVDTMVPEAAAESHDHSGLIAAAGFLLAFYLSKSGG